MKRFFVLLLIGVASVVWAQTNTNRPAQKDSESRVEISSDSGHFDGNTRQMIYVGHVFVSDNAKANMHCDQLTVDLPTDGGHPTNIVAESNVAIDVLDGKGQTNHITADKAVYAYHVTGSVTNETVTFTGGQNMPRVENPQLIIYGEPLILNVAAKTFGGSNWHTVTKQGPKSSGGTNESPFNFLK